MGKKRCFSTVVEAANRMVAECGEDYSLDEQKQKKLWSACAIIDKMAGDGMCEFSRTACDKSSGLAIILGCEYDMVLEDGRSHSFFALIKMFDSFSIRKADQDKVDITLNLNGLWVQNNGQS
jgi:hypothetical protein